MCKLSDSVVDKEFLDCPFKYKWCSVVVAGIFFFLRYSFACVRLALFSHAWTVILWHWIKFLGTKILHRNATCTNYSQEKFPCLKRLVVGWSLMLSGFFRRFPGYPLRFLKATLIQRWSTKLWWSCKRVIKVGGGGGYWSRIENKMTVSHFSDNKFGISRFTRKKGFYTISFSYFG